MQQIVLNAYTMARHLGVGKQNTCYMAPPMTGIILVIAKSSLVADAYRLDGVHSAVGNIPALCA